MITFLQLIAALLCVATVHELGHYLVARLFGVRVPLVQVGAGYTLFDIPIGHTRFALGWTCLGGFTRIHGMDSQDKALAGGGDYRELHTTQRILLVLAGVGANVLLPMVVYAATAWHDGAALLHALNVGAHAPLAILVDTVQAWAQGLGLMDGDSAGAYRFDGTLATWLRSLSILSLVLGLMNLLPTAHTDGGRLWRILRDEE